MTKNEQAKQAAIADLKNHIHEGDVIYTVVRHRSDSGMYRAIDCYVFKAEIECQSCKFKYGECLNVSIPLDCKSCGDVKAVCVVTKLRYTWSIATALGYRYDKKHEAIGIGGCGFSADGQIVSDLSYALFGSSDKLRKEEI